MDRIWIGLKLKYGNPEWVDQSPVDYVNINPLVLGMHRDIKVNVSPRYLHCLFETGTRRSVCRSLRETSCTKSIKCIEYFGLKVYNENTCVGVGGYQTLTACSLLLALAGGSS